MTTTSYPAAGNNGLTIDQWPEAASIGDGIIEDYVGTACDLDRLNSTDIARVHPGKVRVGGYVLDITAAEDLYCAPVVTGNPAVTYYIAAMYDPALNVPDGSGNRSTLGPCRLIINAGAPSTAAGQEYTLLYTLTRTANQLIASTTKRNYRVWVGPQLEFDDEAGSPSVAESPVGFGPYPRGTTIWNRASNIRMRLTLGSGGTLQWQRAIPSASPLPLASGFTALDTDPQYLPTNDAGEVRLAGTVKRSNNNPIVGAAATADVRIATIPLTYAPARIKRFMVYGGGQRAAFIKVTSAGEVFVYAGGVSLDWVDLSPCTWQIGT